MTAKTVLGRALVRVWTGAALCTTVSLGLAGCALDNDKLLGVTDPDIIPPGDIQTPEAAVALANGALNTFRNITGGAESTWLFGGLLADEWSTSSTFIENDETDQRRVREQNGSVTTMIRNLYRVRTRANNAIAALTQYSPTNRALRGEMYLARGFAELQMASDFCNGLPIGNTAALPPENGIPLTTVQVFGLAAASLDSAIAFADGTDAASVRVARAARIARARVALQLADFTNAATFVAGIPTSYLYQHTFSLTTGSNTLWGQGLSARRYSVGDSVEGNSRNIRVTNAIPFASSRDTRLPTTIPTTGAINGQDGQTYSRTTAMWGQLTSVDVANGVDARLIEAEVALRAGNTTLWLSTLNALRAAPPKLGEIQSAVLPALVDPGNADARLSLQFREKAFWTFSRGQRLGDLRRLIRQYGRTEAATFPQGVHYKGGVYGTDVNLPVVTDERNNPNFKGCTDRNP
jgi:starch-binding outer membrane protein, SusD/RagB family